MEAFGSYLKKHTEALVKYVGIEPACEMTGKSKATLGRYYSDHDEHSERFMPIDAVVHLERKASYPHVTSALAELNGGAISFDERRPQCQTQRRCECRRDRVEPAFCDVDVRIPAIHRGRHYHDE